MKIDVTKIKDGEEIVLSHTYDPEAEDLHFDDCFYSAGLELKGNAERQEDTLHVRVHLTTTCELTCSRCLDIATRNRDEFFDNVYDIRGKSILDISSDIREHMILLHEQRYLCSDDCKGLCPHCGINLNVRTCTCEVDESTNKFLKFKELLNKKRSTEENGTSKA